MIFFQGGVSAMLVPKLFDRIVSGTKKAVSRRKSLGKKLRRATFHNRFPCSRQLETLEDRRLLVVGAFAIPAAVAPDFSGVVFLGASRGGCGGTLLDSGLHVLTAAHCISNNESQIIDLGSPTGGTFTLTYVDQTTAPIAFDATAGDIRAALEALPNIDQVAVFADPDGDPTTADFRVEFRGNLALTDVPEMTGDDSNLVGGVLTITTDRNGRLAETTTVNFDVDDGGGGVATFSIPASVTVHPDYNGNTRDGNDITMLRLERVGTFAAERHPIYRDSDEVGQNFTVVGYGHTGTGADGRDETSGGTKRSGMNTWDALGDILAQPPVSSFNLPAGTTLTYDFDNSSAPAANVDPANTTDFFGLYYNILHNGLGAAEAMQSAGDSGGPALIGNAVSGVVSFSRQRLDSPPDVDDDGNNSFGEFAVMTRVSAFQGWIDSWVADPGPVVIDMTDQVGGNDGAPDEIRLVLNGADLEIHYNGMLVNTSAFAAVTNIEVHGSSDDDTLIVDNTGGLVIPPDGIEFHGNGEILGDSLRVIGDGTHTGDYTPDAIINGDGLVTVNGRTISFTGLEPVEISGMASFTFITPNDADVLTIENATGSGGEDAIQITGTSGGVGFEVPTFFDVATVIVDANTNHAGNAMDKVTVNITTAPQGISTLAIQTGDGDDLVRVHATSAGLATEIDTAIGPEDMVLIGINDFADFATGLGDASNILGDVYVTDSGIARLVIDNSASAADQSVFVENVASIVGLFGTYGHQVRGIAPANILYNTDEDGAAFGISDLSIATGSGDDTLTVNFDAAGAPGTFQTPLADGFMDGFDLIWDAGPDGGFVSSEFNVLQLTGGGEIARITYDADSINSGTITIEDDLIATSMTHPPATIRVTGLSRLTDLTTTDDRVFNNLTPGHQEMVYGRGDLVREFLNSCDPDITMTGGVESRDLIIDPRVLMNDMDGGFAPWEFFSDYDNAGTPETITINAGDDGEDNDTVKIFLGNTEIVNVNTGDGVDVIAVFNTSQIVNIDGGPPGAFPGDTLAFPEGVAGGLLTVPNGSAMLPAGGVVNWVDIEELVTPDHFEPNDSLLQATVLGSGKWIIERKLSIHSASDEDWFRVTAHDSGVLQVNVHYVWAENKDLELAIFDADGDLIAQVDTQADDEFLAIPVVAQQRYHIRVRGSEMADVFCSCQFVNYSLEVENTPLLAAPAGMHMAPASDTGVLNNDLITADTTPTFFVEARMARYTDPNNDGMQDIDLLTPEEAQAGNVPGFAILVTISDSDTGDTFSGYATQVGSSRLFRFTPAAALPDAVYFVSAAIQVFDGSTPTIQDEGPSTHPLWVTIDTEPPTGTVPALLASSDSGMLDNDHVTKIQAPAFNGDGEPNALVRILADGVIIGQGAVTADGRWEVTVEPLRDGQYVITAEFEDAAGNIFTTAAMAPDLVIDTAEPNTPYLDLLNDTGRNDTDNVTQENLLEFLMVGNDTIDGNGNPAPHDVIYRLYWRPGDAAGEVLVYDSWAEFSDFTTLGQLTRTVSQDLNDPNGTPLPDGWHNFNLEVEDRAGNISHDFLLTVVVDTVPFLGAGDLHPDSDSGLVGYLATMADRITNVQTPSFFGTAEANNMVTAVINGVPAGTTVAVPFDGNDAFQPPNSPYEGVQGNWRIDTNLLLADGQHSVFFVFEDVAGNRIASEPFLFFVDTQGPRITAVEINQVDHPYKLFDPKSDLPPEGGPTPLVNSLVISVSDLPLRTDDFQYDAVFVQTATHPGHYLVVGDHNGTIAIKSVTFTSVNDGPGLATGYLTVEFFEPLPDDRFTLTVSDAITDIAGNALDGESNAMEPNGAPLFPSGDGQPGGSFVARFTVDSRAEIGVWAAGTVYVDTNGNFIHDPTGKDGDFTNRDITYMFGLPSDQVFAGNFSDPGSPADGFDKLAAYGRYGGGYRWLIDTDNNGVPNWNLPDSLNIDGLPLAGRFWDEVVRNGIDIDPNSDQVGIKQGTTWYLDTNANLIIDAGDAVLAGNMPGMPIVGDFDGDGIDDLGSWANDVFYLNLSTMLTGNPNPASYHPHINGIWDVKFDFGFTGVRERPFAADFDGDGIDDIGLWVPDRSGATPVELAEWYILNSGGSPLTDRIENSMVTGRSTIHFTPRPFGNDLYAQFGDNFALPVVGNFDPPVVPLSGGAAGPMTNTNPDNPLDVNADGIVSPLDVLLVINTINHLDQYIGQGAFAFSKGIFPDVNGDAFITPMDALLLINHINSGVGAVPGAEGESSVLQATLAFLDLDVPVNASIPAASIDSPSDVDALDGVITAVVPSADWPGVQVAASEVDPLFAEAAESQDRDHWQWEDQQDDEEWFDSFVHDVDRWWNALV